MAKIIKNEKIYFGKEILCPFNLKILKAFINGSTISEAAKNLGISSQLIMYYVNKYRKLGLLEKIKEGKKVIYKTYKAYFFIIDENPDAINISTNSKVPPVLNPFIKDNIFDGIIVLGSPDPHGPFSARSRDLHYSGYLISKISKFFTSTTYNEFIRLDTEVVREKILFTNLIIIGGPVANVITYKLNISLKIRFLQEYNWDIYSEFSNRRFSEDFAAIIIRTKNPWSENNKILLLAGKRAIGTKLAIQFFIKNINSFEDKDFYLIINGVDLDGDGIPEEYEILEKGNIKY